MQTCVRVLGAPSLKPLQVLLTQARGEPKQPGNGRLDQALRRAVSEARPAKRTHVGSAAGARRQARVFAVAKADAAHQGCVCGLHDLRRIAGFVGGAPEHIDFGEGEFVINQRSNLRFNGAELLPVLLP